MGSTSNERQNTDGEEAAEHSVEDASRLSARLIYEVIRRDGQDEMTRPVQSLVFSGLAAGILISFSVIGEAIFRTYIPPVTWRFLIENVGYTFGFLLVIMGRMQLFTENTITTVLPLMAHPCRRNVLLVLRLWTVVLTANTVGAFVAAGFLYYSGAFQPQMMESVHALSEHAMSFAPLVAFAKAMPAGVLVAAIVWMLPTTPRNPFFVILTFTWLIAAGDFTHIVAGSVEMAYLIMTGDLGLVYAAFGFFVPVLLGNVAGGTAVFTMITWAQVKNEVETSG